MRKLKRLGPVWVTSLKHVLGNGSWNMSGILQQQCCKTQSTFDLNIKLPFSNSSNSTSCRANSGKSNRCQLLSLWASPFTVMDRSSWVMICQSQEILIFPELHQFVPYCHSPWEILMGIISHAGGLTQKVGVCAASVFLLRIKVVICKAMEWAEVSSTHAVVHFYRLPWETLVAWEITSLWSVTLFPVLGINLWIASTVSQQWPFNTGFILEEKKVLVSGIFFSSLSIPNS